MTQNLDSSLTDQQQAPSEPADTSVKDTQQTTTPPVNAAPMRQVFLITGKSGTGKSSCLVNLRKPEGVLYLNCEAGKELPFVSTFKQMQITDPKQVHKVFDQLLEKDAQGEFVRKDIHTVVIDSVSFMMDMYENQHVLTSDDTRAAWGDYQRFFHKLMMDYVAKCPQNVIFLSHVAKVETKDPTLPDFIQAAVKGQLRERSIEAYFTFVFSTKVLPLDHTVVRNLDPDKTKTLRQTASDILEITDDDELLGRLHVFQTKLVQDSVGEKIKSPHTLFKLEQAFMNNCAQKAIDLLCKFYNKTPIN